MKKIDDKIKNLKHISSMTLKIINILSDEKHSRTDIAKIVEFDSILTAKILKAVNSAKMGIRKEITSVSQAIAYIGEQTISSIAISLGMTMLKDPLKGYMAKKDQLWFHDLKTAIAARIIAKECKKELNYSSIYTAGLLHDIGKIVLSDFIDFENSPIETSKNFLDYERSQTNTTHCEVGKKMAKLWNLPDIFKNVIEFHHTPSKAPDKFKIETYIIHLADFISMQTGDDTGIDSLLYDIDENWINYINIDRNKICNIILKTIQEFSKIKTNFNGE